MHVILHMVNWSIQQGNKILYMIKQAKIFHTKMRSVVILTMIVLCVSPIYSQDYPKCDSIAPSVYEQNRWMIEQWQEDSCGCQRIRDAILAKLIIEKFDLKGKPKEQFLKCFGKPNKIYDGNLYYFIKSYCDEGKLMGDKTTMEFLFDKNDKLIDLSDCLDVE